MWSPLPPLSPFAPVTQDKEPTALTNAYALGLAIRTYPPLDTPSADRPDPQPAGLDWAAARAFPRNVPRGGAASPKRSRRLERRLTWDLQRTPRSVPAKHLDSVCLACVGFWDEARGEHGKSGVVC